MRKQNAQVAIHKDTPIAMAKDAKELVKTLTTAADGDWSPVRYMNDELENLYSVTTYRRTGVGYQTEPVRRACRFKRISPLTVKVKIENPYTSPVIEIEFLAEGSIEDQQAMAKITIWGKWEDGWYSWDRDGVNATANAPYAQVYTAEQ